MIQVRDLRVRDGPWLDPRQPRARVVRPETIRDPRAHLVERELRLVGVEPDALVVACAVQFRQALVDPDLQVGEEDAVRAEVGGRQHLVETVFLAPAEGEIGIPAAQVVV